MAPINRIEVCGNIASGKTTFAVACGKMGCNIILEDFSSVPFLEDFYGNPDEFAFETETAFTLLHYYQLKKLGSEPGVCDFSLLDDYAFALTTLTEREFIIYEKMFDYIIAKIGIPQKIIRLDAPIDVLFNRINKRGRRDEHSISTNYLLRIQENMNKAYSRKFAAVPILEINTTDTSPSEYDIDFISIITK
ncbi:MAG: deoxynucleoside kinase [Spirochaetaceae bacterium]|jgi:deoxyadenosine/deoxycytidine kinase|nr:deoxynucleoside kinase [Spirochaetaceae bacterium]